MLQLKHMYQFNCSLSHPETLQNSWGTSQSKDACVSFGSHPPLGPFIPSKPLWPQKMSLLFTVNWEEEKDTSPLYNRREQKP